MTKQEHRGTGGRPHRNVKPLSAGDTQQHRRFLTTFGRRRAAHPRRVGVRCKCTPRRTIIEKFNCPACWPHLGPKLIWCGFGAATVLFWRIQAILWEINNREIEAIRTRHTCRKKITHLLDWFRRLFFSGDAVLNDIFVPRGRVARLASLWSLWRDH